MLVASLSPLSSVSGSRARPLGTPGSKPRWCASRPALPASQAPPTGGAGGSDAAPPRGAGAAAPGRLPAAGCWLTCCWYTNTACTQRLCITTCGSAIAA
jgi:hypothetical protein